MLIKHPFWLHLIKRILVIAIFILFIPNHSFCESGWGTVDLPLLLNSTNYDTNRSVEQPSALVLTPEAVSENQALESFGEAEITSRIASLAISLENNPVYFYNYVANEIEYLPYYGSKKSSQSTLITQKGNDWDQASLLIALLRSSGIQANYASGLVVYPVSFLANVLGIAPDKELVLKTFINGGYIDVAGYQDNFIQLRRVWVTAEIEGTIYVFDPAFSVVQVDNGIDLAGAMGFSDGDFYTAAVQGAFITDDYVKNINETAIRDQLSTYTLNLVNWIKENRPGATTDEIIGSRKTIKTERELLTTLPGADSVSDTISFGTISDANRFKVNIQYHGIDKTFYGYEISGKSIRIIHTGENNAAVLMLDDSVEAEGLATEVQEYNFLDISAVHPYETTDFDQSSRTYIQSPYSYVLAIDVGGSVSSKMLKEQIDQYNQESSANQLENTAKICSKLELTGLNYLNQVAMAGRVLDRISGGVGVRHHKIGILGQEKAPFMDMRLGRRSFFALSSASQNTISNHFIGAGLASAFEHAALEQVGTPAISSVKAVALNNRSGGMTFLANQSNYSTETEGSIRAVLGGEHKYSPKWTNAWQQMIDRGQTILIPENRQIQQDNWRGFSFIGYDSDQDNVISNISYQIGGGIVHIENGGHGTTEGEIEAVDQETWTSEEPTESVADPVDIISGYFMDSHTDLALSSRPLAVVFSRSYTSHPGSRAISRGLGYGWTHNLDIYIEPDKNNPDAAAGYRTPIDAAALITGTKVMADMAQANPEDPVRMMINNMVQQWVTDQITGNSTVIHFGGQTYEYIRLPDGTYNPPPGISATLTKASDDTFTLTELSGTQYVTDSDNRISYIKDIYDNRLSYNYTGGLLQSVANNFGDTVNINYAEGMITSVNDSTGRSIRFEYDENNDLFACFDPENKRTVYVYDENHNLVKRTNPLEIDAVVNRYDELGRVTEQDVPTQNGIATYQFFFNDSRNRMIKPSGEEVVYNLDEKKRIRSIRNGLLNSTVYEYDARNNVIRQKDLNGNETSFAYDDLDRLTSITDALDSTTIFDWDENNDLATTTNPLGNTVQFEYTDHLPFAVHTYPSRGKEIITFASYNDLGLTETITNGTGHTSQFQYSSGQLSQSWVESHPPVQRSYYETGKLWTLTDQAGAVTTFTWDNSGKLLARQDPFGLVASYDYDNADRLIGVTDRNNETTTYSYTPDAKLETIEYHDGTYVDFLYHPLSNRLMSMTDITGITSYSYDDLGRIKTATDVHGFAIAYDYDNAGNITIIAYPGNQQVIYTYDELNRIKTVNIGSGQMAEYFYDPAGRLTEVTNFNSSRTEYAYDNADRLTGIKNLKSDGTVIASFNFTLDDNGRRTGIIEDVPVVSLSAQADKNYTYNDLKNRIESAGDVIITHDNEGQISTEGPKVFTFDSAHRLASVSGTNPYSFTYNGAGARVSATRDSVTTHYIYDPSGNLIAEADEAFSITKFYIYGSGLLAAVTPEGQTFCYHFDGTGSTIAVTDLNQEIVNSYAYSPFGIILGQEETLDQPFKYVGQYGVMAEPDGLYYMRARYYDPDTGRFISEDPIGFDGGSFNLYTYVLNDPVNFIDPEGNIRIPGSGKAISWFTKWLSKKNGGKIGEKLGEVGDLFNPEIGYPDEQQEMDKDTDGDGLNDHFDPDDDGDGILDDVDPKPKESQPNNTSCN